MKYVFPKSLAGILVVLLTYQASAQGAEIVIECQADFSVIGMGAMAVQITKEDQGRLQSQINGTVSNQNVKLDEYPVQENLNMRTDPARAVFDLNAGEFSLVYLQGMMDLKDIGPVLKIPFDLKQVKKMKIYDLQGRQDKFGGTVLMEAYNREGKLLGRVYRAVLTNGCY